jgi:GDP-L-fucose synthase
MNLKSKIYVAGHNGLVGSAIIRKLKSSGYENLIVKTHSELDLTDQLNVSLFFEKEKPDYVVLAAAKVGGIEANNTYRADFIFQNLQIQNNVIHQSYLHGIKKLLFLGSSCIYPKNSTQPLSEESLLTGPLEFTNEPYAIAKIAGMKMCESYNLQYGTNFISLMPTNLYGQNDNFDLKTSHVIPALIKKIHDAKKQNLMKVEIWGSGNPIRDFLYSDDFADSAIFVLESVNFEDLLINKKRIINTHINIGTGIGVSIKELALIIKKVVDYKGEFIFNTSKPDGTMLKVIDVKKINLLGWKYKVNLEDGIDLLYNWYLGKINT